MAVPNIESSATRLMRIRALHRNSARTLAVLAITRIPRRSSNLTSALSTSRSKRRQNARTHASPPTTPAFGALLLQATSPTGWHRSPDRIQVASLTHSPLTA